MALYCDECLHTRFYKSDKKPVKGRRWWRCANCGHIQLGYRPQEGAKPRELYVDIETSPNLAYLYDLRVPSKFINSDMIIKDWFIIGWAAKWVNCFNHREYSYIGKRADILKWDDSQILSPLWALLNEADIVWGHNMASFDRKKINTRFLIHKMPPPEKYRVLDTLKIARSNFAFASNKLDFINSRIGAGRKDDVTFEDWQALLRGDNKAIQKIKNYNLQDVRGGVETVNKMREWLQPFPKVHKYIRPDSV